MQGESKNVRDAFKGWANGSEHSVDDSNPQGIFLHSQLV